MTLIRVSITEREWLIDILIFMLFIIFDTKDFLARLFAGIWWWCHQILLRDEKCRNIFFLDQSNIRMWMPSLFHRLCLKHVFLNNSYRKIHFALFMDESTHVFPILGLTLTWEGSITHRNFTRLYWRLNIYYNL